MLPADPGTVPIPDDLRVTDMVAGPGHSILYVGGANGAFVHRIVAIDGATRSILWALPVGNEPSVLAISNDGTRLYVGSTRASTIRAVDLTERRACRTFALDPHGVTVAMAVPATAPQTVLVASSSDTLAAYDSGVRRPEIADASVWPGTSFAVLGATDAFVGDSDRYAIDWRGVRWLTPGPPRTVHRTVQLAGGLLYSESGAIIDPAPPAFVRGWLPVPGPHVVDPSIQRAFTAVYPDLIVTDLTTLLEVRREPIGDFITVHDMVRWGADGVALRGSRVGEIGNLFLKSGVVRP
ncbi:MAG: hypothetical protein GWN07_16655 [Actinobacteria bacterium]|nr:hypothetical protein [Actinomycetota bacterium]